MIVLADSNITKATVSSGTPVLADAERVQNYILADSMETDGLFLDLLINFDQGEIPQFDTIGICGHTIEKGVSVTITLSNIDFDNPEESHEYVIPYGFNDPFLLDAVVSYQYVRMSAINTDSSIKVGFIDIGVRTEFPDPRPISRQTPTGSVPSLNDTRQPFGSKRYGFDRYPMNFVGVKKEKMIEILENVWDKVYNVIPVLWLVHESGEIDRLNHAGFGIIENTSLDAPRRSRDGDYDFSITFGGTF